MDTERKPSFNWDIYRSSKQGCRISNNRKAKKTKSNLEKGEKDALKELLERTDVLITNFENGGAVVILETKDYINEASRQLNVTFNFKDLPNDRTVRHNNETIDRFKQEQLIPKETAETLEIIDPEAPKFHMLPKIYKSHNPERPVLSSIGCHSTIISKFVLDLVCFLCARFK